MEVPIDLTIIIIIITIIIYSLSKTVRFKTPMIRSDLGDYSDAYILVKRTIEILVAAANENDRK